MACVNQTQKMIPFITCEIPLGQYVCELVFGVNVFDLDLGVQIDSIEQPIKSNSVGSGNMFHCGLLPFVIILITASWSSNTYNKASWWEDLTIEGIKSTLSKSLITLWDCLRLWTVLGGEQTSRLFFNKSPLLYGSDSCPRTADPMSQEREDHPTSILHPKKWFLILLNCVKLKFVSYTSNSPEQMYDFQKRTMFHPK